MNAWLILGLLSILLTCNQLKAEPVKVNDPASKWIVFIQWNGNFIVDGPLGKPRHETKKPSGVARFLQTERVPEVILELDKGEEFEGKTKDLVLSLAAELRRANVRVLGVTYAKGGAGWGPYDLPAEIRKLQE